MESSTLTACGPCCCISISVRPKQGKSNASLPQTKWLRFNFVAICTVKSQRRKPSCVYGVSGVATAKLPPKPIKTFTPPSYMALMVSTTPKPCSRGDLMPNTRSRLSSNFGLGRSLIPMVRSPCTLLCPRIGAKPAPGRPICPLANIKFASICTFAVPFRCCVIPMPQQKMAVLASKYILAKDSKCSGLSPVCA